MKNIVKHLLFITFPILLFTENTFATPTGSWYGNLSVQGTVLKLVIHIEKDGETYRSKFDSPDQSAYDIPFEQTNFDNNRLTCTKRSMGIEYSAELRNDTLDGIWKQGGMSVPLVMTKEDVQEKKQYNRPQEPKGKLKYTAEDVSIFNPKTRVTLAGTLTKPKGKGPFPAVVLVSGSGAQDRNSEIFNHKPFLVLSDFLTRQGIAVLRYDDRGTAKSTGEFDTATSADLADDAEAAFEFLRTQKNINPNKTGIIGHSEGGMIAPIVAARNKNVSFIVAVAAPGVPLIDLLLKQIKDVSEAAGVQYEEIKEILDFSETYFRFLNQTPDYKTAYEKSDSVLNAFVEQYPLCTENMILGFRQTIEAANAPWFHYFIRFVPEEYLTKVSCPVLAVNGKLDVQVSAAENLEAIGTHLSNSDAPFVKIIEYSDLNHLMQKAETGSVSEYATIEETFNEKAMKDIADWILKLK